MARSYRRTTLITVFCFCILAGLGAARRVNFEPSIWLLLFTQLLFLIRKKKTIALYIVITLGVGLGLWRGGIFMDKLGELKSLSDQKVTVEAVATSTSSYGKHSQMEFTANQVKLQFPYKKPLAGDIKVSGFGEPMIYRGDKVTAQGKLFPTRGSNQALMSYAQIKRTGEDKSLINKLTRDFGAGMQSALPEPASSFGLGILIGQRSTLPEALIASLTAVGLVHIVAVSGYNLTILVRATARLKLGSKYQRLIISLTLIALFLLVTGFGASIVRAAIVSILSLIAWYYGRRIRPILIIAFTAVLTGFVRPFYVWGDLGWYLSMLAFFGVLILAPMLVARFTKNPPKMLTLVLIETLCAEIMTLPLIMMTFGYFSLVSLAANLLIVPLVPLAMLLGAAAGIAGTWLPAFSGWVAWPAKFLITYMLDVIQILSGIPMASVNAQISPTIMLSIYAFVLVTALITVRRVKGRINHQSGIITEVN